MNTVDFVKNDFICKINNGGNNTQEEFNKSKSYLREIILSNGNQLRGIEFTNEAWNKIKELIADYIHSDVDVSLGDLSFRINNALDTLSSVAYSVGVDAGVAASGQTLEKQETLATDAAIKVGGNADILANLAAKFAADASKNAGNNLVKQAEDAGVAAYSWINFLTENYFVSFTNQFDSNHIKRSQFVARATGAIAAQFIKDGGGTINEQAIAAKEVAKKTGYKAYVIYPSYAQIDLDNLATNAPNIHTTATNMANHFAEVIFNETSDENSASKKASNLETAKQIAASTGAAAGDNAKIAWSLPSETNSWSESAAEAAGIAAGAAAAQVIRNADFGNKNAQAAAAGLAAAKACKAASGNPDLQARIAGKAAAIAASFYCIDNLDYYDESCFPAICCAVAGAVAALNSKNNDDDKDEQAKNAGNTAYLSYYENVLRGDVSTTPPGTKLVSIPGIDNLYTEVRDDRVLTVEPIGGQTGMFVYGGFIKIINNGYVATILATGAAAALAMKNAGGTNAQQIAAGTAAIERHLDDDTITSDVGSFFHPEDYWGGNTFKIQEGESSATGGGRTLSDVTGWKYASQDEKGDAYAIVRREARGNFPTIGEKIAAAPTASPTVAPTAQAKTFALSGAFAVDDFITVKTDSDNLATYTVKDGDDLFAITGGLVAALADNSVFTASSSPPGNLVLTDKVVGSVSTVTVTTSGDLTITATITAAPTQN